MNKIRKSALINSLAATAYIVAVAAFMFYAGSMKLGRANTFLVPVALLMLFVFSAALTGFLILGKPAQMYLDGKKKDALSLLTNTLMFLFAITVIFMVLLIVFTR
jgi:hypothetical protein